ncbi:MAG: carbohydrate ABC transporter permease, partial [Acidimicrobiales bacterium]
LLGAVLTAALGYVLSTLDQPLRLVVGTAGGAALGLLIGGLAFSSIIPRIQVTSAIAWPVGLALIGAGLSRSRGKPILGGALVGALIGWIIGVFVVTDAGGPRLEALSAFGVAGALAGARFSVNPRPNALERTEIENRSRSWIFLAPSMFVVLVGLIAPLIRTIALSFERSFRDDAGQRVQEFPSMENYRGIFGNATNWDFDNWRALFTSAPFEIGMLLIAVAIGFAIYTGRRSGNSFAGSRYIMPIIGLLLLFAGYREFRLIQDLGNSEEALGAGLLAQDTGAPSWRYLYLVLFLALGVGLLLMSITRGRLAGLDGFNVDLGGGHAGSFAFGLFLIVTAGFAAVRGTVINSVWWVFAVTVIATSFGLAVAALADRARMENVAKSIIFMPLAISFVGAGIIWRFMYIARPGTDPQTGLLNWTWLKMGDLSLSGSRWIVVLLLAALVAGLVWVAWRGWQSGSLGLTGGSLTLMVPMLWLLWRLAAGRLGGTGLEGEGECTLIFISQNLPYNNLWLMVVLIWIQTGFAMVIFSAAIKAVPQEYIEAAKVDGATDSSIFWRIIVPSILPTIGVVVTTLVVTVLKIFDVVKVMTNGNFETQIVANEMIFQAFTAGNRGLGSALAVVLFVAVLPVVYFNVRRLQQEDA